MWEKNSIANTWSILNDYHYSVPYLCYYTSAHVFTKHIENDILHLLLWKRSTTRTWTTQIQHVITMNWENWEKCIPTRTTALTLWWLLHVPLGGYPQSIASDELTDPWQPGKEKWKHHDERTSTEWKKWNTQKNETSMKEPQGHPLFQQIYPVTITILKTNWIFSTANWLCFLLDSHLSESNAWNCLTYQNNWQERRHNKINIETTSAKSSTRFFKSPAVCLTKDHILIWQAYQSINRKC